MAAARSATPEDVALVWETWQTRQRRPDLVRLTDERVKLIRKRIALGYTAAELAALIRFAFEADDKRARFWRGQNATRTTYLDLENLFRESKLGHRIPVAMEWAEVNPPPNPDGTPGAAVAPRGPSLTPPPAASEPGPSARHRSTRRARTPRES